MLPDGKSHGMVICTPLHASGIRPIIAGRDNERPEIAMLKTRHLPDLRPFFLLLAVSGLFLMTILQSGTAFAQTAETETSKSVQNAIVRIETIIPGTARTARTLGQSREGSGVVIDSTGLILTVGYLMMEASEATVTFGTGEKVPASMVAYDHETGFGLLRTIKPPSVKPIRLGDSSNIGDGDVLLALSASFDGRRQVDAWPVQILSRRTFAGYWEYLLEDAIFAAPPMRIFGGAALLDEDGTLVGIGSLMVNDAGPAGEPARGNMYIPINSLKLVLGDLLGGGRPSDDAFPWLGVITEEYKGHVLVTYISDESPAQRAGVLAGDLIRGIGGEPIDGMEGFLRAVRGAGPAGAKVQMDLLRPGEGLFSLDVNSMDRRNWLRLRPGN